LETTITCPACGEPTDISLDDEPGRQSLIQDCDVCCRPIQIRARVNADGEVEIDVDRS
jgi:NMD protein affecting ribosome stability and mRNA decay